jgi:hypothetical protein
VIGDLIAGLLGKVLDRAWPDPAQKAAAAQAIAELQQAGEFKQIDAQLAAIKMQTDINAVEAASSDPFTSRWRPFIGWVCGAGFAWNFIGLPVARLLCDVFGHPLAIAPADMSEMLPVLLGMLGLGGMRTFEKVAGKA